MHILSPSLPTSLIHLIRRIIHALSALSIAPSESNTASPKIREEPQHQQHSYDPNSPLATLLANPTLFSPIRAPRLPIVLCHGLYGFDIRGPSSFPRFQYHYWSGVLDVLRKKVGAEVIVTGVSGTGSVEERAAQMDRYLQTKVPGQDINFMAHSMGGLDCRHLISTLKPASRSDGSDEKPYYPKTLTTISTPHQGSPFMDWCQANIGIGIPRGSVNEKKTTPETEQKGATDPVLNPPSGKRITKLPYTLEKPLFSPPSPTLPYPLPLFSTETYTSRLFSLPTLLLSSIDSPAYSNLTTSFLEQFNEKTPNNPAVKYFSVASRKDRSKMGILHPLFLPKVILDNVQEDAESETSSGNDGLVTVSSAKWGEFLGVVDNCDHWEIRGAGGLNKLNINIGNSLGEVLNLGSVMSWAEWKGKDKNEKPSEGGKKEASGRQVKEQTDRLSMLVDWIVDRDTSNTTTGPHGDQEKEYKRAPKWDLERFYVALCRKLYDEGF